MRISLILSRLIRLVTCLVITFIYCNCCLAQGTNANDTGTINVLERKAEHTADPDSAILLFKLIVNKSIAADYPTGVATALINMGYKYIEIGNYPQALAYFNQAFPYCTKSNNKEAVAAYYNSTGIVYYNQGDYIRASEYYYTALKELKKVSNAPSRRAVEILNNLANINLQLNQNEKALSFYYEAAAIARKGDFRHQLAMVQINIGEYFMAEHKLDSAKSYFLDGMNISLKNDYIDLQAYANKNLGAILVESKEYDKAIPYLKLAIDLVKNKYNNVVIEASYSLGEALYAQGKTEEAEELLVSALNKAAAANLKDNYTIKGYTTLTEIYKSTGQYKQAVDCLSRIAVLKDSLTSAEKAQVINQLDIKFKTAEKDKLIAEQKNKITQKNLWISVIAGSIFIFGFIVLALYRNSIHKQKLQAEQMKSLQQENKIGILKAIVQGEEKERSRIAGELHDGIGGMLSAAMMRFMAIRHQNEEITKIPAYHEVMDLLDEIGDEIRKTAHNLMPEVLLKQNLPEAVRSFCNYVQEGGSLQIDFQCYGEFDNLTQDVKLNVYRIIQELLKNITQHSGANQALVQLLINEELLTITVEDNGTGFNKGEIINGIGLLNIQTRVSSLDGNYTLESEKGKGTSVYIEFDLSNITANASI